MRLGQKDTERSTNLMVYLTVTWTKIQFAHLKKVNNKTFALLIRTKGLSDRSNSGKENLQADMCILY